MAHTIVTELTAAKTNEKKAIIFQTQIIEMVAKGRRKRRRIMIKCKLFDTVFLDRFRNDDDYYGNHEATVKVYNTCQEECKMAMIVVC